MVSCSSVLILQTYRSICGLFPLHDPSGQSWVCITDLQHEASWSREGIATSLSSYRLAPFIMPADKLGLCVGEKRKRNKKPTTYQAVCSKNGRFLHQVLLLMLHSGPFWPKFSSWPHLPWLSSKSCLKAHFPPGSSTVRNYCYMCTLKKNPKPKNLRNMHRPTKQALKEQDSSWFRHTVPAIYFVSACCSHLQDTDFIAECFLGLEHFWNQNIRH